MSEEELGSLAVNIGSLNAQRGGSSDTEGDFLDKSFDSKKEALERANRVLQDDEYKWNMADDEHSVCGSDMGRGRDKKSVKVTISLIHLSYPPGYPQSPPIHTASYGIL